MKNKNNILFALCLLLFGILSLLNYTNILKITIEEISGIALLVFGLITSNQTFGNKQRGMLSLAVIAFLIGIVLLTRSRFDLLDMRGIIFTSILFIGGAVFIILFLDNPKHKAFLYSGICLIFLSIATVTFLKDLGIFSVTNSIDKYFEYFWPVILIVMGIGLFHSRKN
jgi:hypothetical protein